jgi:hypothetical protein
VPRSGKRNRKNGRRPVKGLYYLFPTLLAILVSLLVVRAAAIALMMTGLDRRRAVFQALSAFTGTGFTTREAESVINHPQRRKIISRLMILGNAGIVTVMVTATSSLVAVEGVQIPINVIILVAGLLVIYKIATHRGFIKRWEQFIEDKLVKSRAMEEAPVEDLLHLLEGHGLVKLIVQEGSAHEGKTVMDFRSAIKGAIILGIEREGQWLPVPRHREVIQAGDRLVIYGRLTALETLRTER